MSQDETTDQDALKSPSPHTKGSELGDELGDDIELTLTEDPHKELWREAWVWRKQQQKELRAERIRDLREMRQKLHDDARTVDDALSELEGKGDWTQLMRPLASFGWLRCDPPPREALLEYRSECVLPLGKVGFFVGEGGIGKSWAMTQLALAVCTGTPWLERFTVPAEAIGGVVMAMGEEDEQEMHRRIFQIVEATGMAAHHKSMLEGRLWPLPLSGHMMEFLDGGERSFDHERFEQLLLDYAPEEGWKLIVLDPASRFMGVDAEKDNAYATRFVQILERLTKLPGHPTVLCAHHTSKASRTSTTGARSVAARGASALTDGARWQGNLFVPIDKETNEPDDGLTVFQISKSNYGPKPPALYLRRQTGSGVLIPFDDYADNGFEEIIAHTGKFDEDSPSPFAAEDTLDFQDSSVARARKKRPSYSSRTNAFDTNFDF